MSNRHANIDEYTLAVWVLYYPGEHLPRVQEGVALQKMIKAAIAGGFQLGAYSKCGSLRFRLSDARDNSLCIAFEVESPLIQGAGVVSKRIHGPLRRSSRRLTHHVASVTRWPIISVGGQAVLRMCKSDSTPIGITRAVVGELQNAGRKDVPGR